jgi:ribosomal protein S18 acetylase RimI-like enzyme
MLVQFSRARIVEFSDPKAFSGRTQRWLTLREGENHFFLAMLPGLVAGGPREGMRFFVIEEDKELNAAGMLLPNGELHLTWATHDMIEMMIDHICRAGWRIALLQGPGHVPLYLGRTYAQRTGQHSEMRRTERLYQLARTFYALPAQGHLEVATVEDRPLIREWMEGYVEETGFETGGQSVDQLMELLIGMRCLYVWKSPMAVSMAAWTSPTPKGAVINFLYTPPELRGQGYGKAVSAALGAQMLAGGLRFCFILTDVNDVRANGLYKAIGARTLCEITRCAIVPGEKSR